MGNNALRPTVPYDVERFSHVWDRNRPDCIPQSRRDACGPGSAIRAKTALGLRVAASRHGSGERRFEFGFGSRQLPALVLGLGALACNLRLGLGGEPDGEGQERGE
jgi:hypothetical protein